MGLISRVSSRTYRQTPHHVEFNPKKYVEETIAKHKVVIFSTTYCPYCRVAQKQFDKLKTNTHKLELDDAVKNKQITSNDFSGIMDYLTETTDKSRTVPKVFVCSDYIGGGTETKNLFKSGKLQELIEKCDRQY